MSLPEPQSVTFTSLFAEIENGTIKIPQFQRDFVWSKARSAKLLDSIVKGYPIGHSSFGRQTRDCDQFVILGALPYQIRRRETQSNMSSTANSVSRAYL